MADAVARAKRLIESGDPENDDRGFRRCLSQYATGVAVVTADSAHGRAGVTVNSFSSVSLNPPLVLWCISRRSRSFAAFESADAFAVNVLATDQIDVAQRFAGPSEDKFAGAKWTPGAHGSPLIDGAAAHLECYRASSHDGGDHLVLIGHVKRYALFESEPLVFSQGRYGRIEDHPELASENLAASGQGHGQLNPDSLPFLTLMFEAYQSAVGGFEAYRAEEGLSRSQVRVMTGLSESPRITLDELARTKYLGVREAEDAVAYLQGRGYVRRGPEGLLDLTGAGRERLDVINRRWAQFGDSRLTGIPRDEVKAARRFMARLLAGAEGSHHLG